MQAALKNGTLALFARSGAVSKTFGVRFYPAIATKAKGSTNEAEPEKSVFISQSSDVFTNLALEDWLYRNFDFNKHRVLLLWRNDPSVVIGRHQNPWAEVDVSVAEQNGVNIARRNSGGGTVYHDKGNLNCTFFTPRNAYDRRSNLDVICKALQRQYGIQADITPRFDVTLNGYKISGTASKLGKNAYHHCTVLVDADLKKLSKLLNPDTEGMDSKATASIKSPVQNVKEANKEVSVEKVLSSIGYEFLRTTSDGNDGGVEAIEKQRGFQMVNPTNEWFPGLEEIKTELKSWSWTYGKTPDFSLSKEYLVGQDMHSLETLNVKLFVEVKKGMISSAMLSVPAGVEDANAFVEEGVMGDLSGFIDAIKGRPFHPGILNAFEGLLFKSSRTAPDTTEEKPKGLQ